MRRVLSSALAFSFVTAMVFAQAPAKPKPLTKNPCEAESKEARLEGWSAGYDAAISLYSRPLETRGQKLKISFVVEDINGADSFRLAAAEVVRTHFSDNLEVDPTGAAELELWIHGTEGRAGVKFQELAVDALVVVSHPFTVNGQTRVVFGSFVLASTSQTLWAYTDEQKTQVMREEVYNVLSDFLQKWQKAEKQ